MGEAPAPLARNSLSDQVRETLLRRILAGELKPGDPLVEMRLAAEMGTSQAPVREALQHLEAIGVVASLPHRGSRVRALDLEALAEIYDVRAELESYAAGLAAKRIGAEIGSLEGFIAEMIGHARAARLPGFAEANARFHRVIVAAAGNRTLLGIWSGLDVRARTMMSVMNTRGDLVAVAESHWPVVHALQDGDAAAARRTMRRHILAARPRPG